MSLAKVSGEDFSRAFLNQVELGRSQPSTRVLRVIAGRLGTEVDYLLEGRLPGVERELALEKGRVLLARGDAGKALAALRPAAASTEWPLGSDARVCQAQALMALGREAEARAILAAEKALITAHGDREHRLSASQPPLALASLTPTALARMLQDCGVKWRVIVVSACYAGGFIEPLRDDNTIVITAAAADRTSFGCEPGRDFTYFGEAYFRDALAGRDDAFLAQLPRSGRRP